MQLGLSCRDGEWEGRRTRRGSRFGAWGALLCLVVVACGDDTSAAATSLGEASESGQTSTDGATSSTEATGESSDATTGDDSATATATAGTTATTATTGTTATTTTTGTTATTSGTDSTSDTDSTGSTTAPGTTGVEPPEGLDDDFAGDGPLLGYTTNNEASLPDIARVGGRYRANLVDNSDNITLHFNQEQGRLDAKLVAFPFDVVARNVGIGTQADSQVAPPPMGAPYIFAGIQVHVTDLESRNSSHIVVGHRGGTSFTIEGKNTVDGSSSVNDVGGDAAPQGRADIRIVGNPDQTLTIHWQVPNLDPENTPDDWTLYGGNGTLPGEAPAYGAEVYVGLITYAFEQTGVPFVGTCDALEEL